MEGKAGVLYLNVKRANLTHDTELMGKMDPYVTLTLGNLTQKTTIKENAGKNPEWNEKFEFSSRSGDILTLVVLDKEDVGTDDEIGHAKLNVNAEALKQKQIHTIPIFYGKDDKSRGGELFVEIEFSPIEDKAAILHVIDNKTQEIETLNKIIRELRVHTEELKAENKKIVQERESAKHQWDEERKLLVKSAEAQNEGNKNHEVELISQLTNLKGENNILLLEKNNLIKIVEESQKKIADLTNDNITYRQKLRNTQKEETKKSPFDFTCCGGALASVLIFTTYVIGSRF